MKYSLNIIGIIFTITLYGQEFKLSGKLMDGSKESVPFANIIAHTDSLKLDALSYTYSDAEGLFSINLPKHLKSVFFNITAFGYAEKKIVLSIEPNKVYEIQMKKRLLNLKR